MGGYIGEREKAMSYQHALEDMSSKKEIAYRRERDQSQDYVADQGEPSITRDIP